MEYTIAISQSSYGMNRGSIENLFSNWAVASFPDPAQPYFSTCNYGGGNGTFMPESVVRIADITDGTSNTFLFGEMSRFPNEPANIFQFSNLASAWGDGTYFASGVRVSGGAFVIPALNSPPDTTGVVFNACFANTVQPPDWLKNSAIPGGPCNTLGQWAFRSFHPGGANFAFADGSVKFIKNSINLSTYRASVRGTSARSSAPTSTDLRRAVSKRIHPMHVAPDRWFLEAPIGRARHHT